MPIKLICASHTPLMDYVDTDPGIDAEVRQHFSDLADQVAAYDPELIIIFAPDHFKGVFYNMLPPFMVGVRATSIGDYDIGGGEFNVPEELAIDCVRNVHDSGVDVSLSYRMQADHGFAQLLVLLGGRVDRYPVLPIHINCAGAPLPPIKRVRELGVAVGNWASKQKLRILILGSGGLSHDPPIPTLKTASPEIVERLIAGHRPSMEERRAREQQNFVVARALARGEGEATPLNPDWDRMVMHRLSEGDTSFLDTVSEDEITQTAGCGGNEVRNWIAAYAALSAYGPYTSKEIVYHPISAWNAGMGISVAEPKNVSA